MKVLLVSTYELGRQPFGLASPAAWLREAGAEVTCVDVSREALDEEAVREADLIAFYVPMHTATRLAVALLPAVKEMNPRAHICFYGLYAPVNEAYLRRLGAGTILGGEFEAGLAKLALDLERGKGGKGSKGSKGSKGQASPVAAGVEGHELQTNLKFEISDFKEPQNQEWQKQERQNRKRQNQERPRVPVIVATGRTSSAKRRRAAALQTISLERLEFLVPDRRGMVALEKYARVMMPTGETRVVGYTEASRGCKHLCRHCPIVPVYGGVFRVVEPDVVMEDVRRQVAAGAQHVTFGDPDFFNGVGHALPIVHALHREFPALTYDVTIKVEHLLKHRRALATLRETGCLFVTSAVESVDDAVLGRLEKNHTRADFLAALRVCREARLTLEPTFVPFSPWTTLEGYCDLLGVLREQGLIENVAPIQLAIRLLIPAGSRLLELEDVRRMVGAFDEEALVYPWRHADARVDELCEEVQRIVHAGEKMGRGRARIFERIEEAAFAAAGRDLDAAHVALPVLASRAAVPYLNEPWYC